jgi:hypothetical protein
MSMFRFSPGVLVALVCLAVAACQDPPSSAVETRISVLHINLRGVADVPDGDAAGLWTTRFNRIGTDLNAAGERPDVIALQEVAGRVWCPFNDNFVLDYEPLRTLLISLQSGIGIQYRIAYYQTFVGDTRLGQDPTSDGGTIRDCRATSGLALLYNPERIRNRETDTPQSTADGATQFNQNTSIPTLRRSMPCCVGKVRPGHEGVCNLIDGPTQTDICGVPRPAGLATQVAGDVAVARLELALRRNTTFHVYNVHLPWKGSNGHTQAQAAVRATLNAVEPNVPRWIPPVMVGDFNNGQEDIREWLGDFDFVGAADLDGIILTLAGNPSHYASSATIASTETKRFPAGATSERCIDAGVLWTDHCAVLTRLVIREP